MARSSSKTSPIAHQFLETFRKMVREKELPVPDGEAAYRMSLPAVSLEQLLGVAETFPDGEMFRLDTNTLKWRFDQQVGEESKIHLKHMFKEKISNYEDIIFKEYFLNKLKQELTECVTRYYAALDTKGTSPKTSDVKSENTLSGWLDYISSMSNLNDAKDFLNILMTDSAVVEQRSQYSLGNLAGDFRSCLENCPLVGGDKKFLDKIHDYFNKIINAASAFITDKLSADLAFVGVIERHTMSDYAKISIKYCPPKMTLQQIEELNRILNDLCKQAISETFNVNKKMLLVETLLGHLKTHFPNFPNISPKEVLVFSGEADEKHAQPSGIVKLNVHAAAARDSKMDTKHSTLKPKHVSFADSGSTAANDSKTTTSSQHSQSVKK